MALSHFLVSYQLTLTCNDSKVDVLAPLSLETVLVESFKNKERRVIVDKYLKLDKVPLFSEHLAHGTFKAGDRGFTAEIIDSETDELILEKKIQDVQALPFFFMVSCFTSKNAILILQRAGHFGIKSALEEDLRIFCEKKFPLYKISFVMKTPNGVAQKFFERAKFTALRFETNQAPQEIEDSLRDHDGSYSAEIRITKDSIIKRLIHMVRSPNNRKDFKLYNTPISRIKVESSVGGRKATFSLGAIADTDIAFEIDKKYIKENGHPDYKQMCVFAKNIINDLTKG